MTMLRSYVFACLLVSLSAAPAFAQVRVTAQLEKAQYLEGEPVVVVIEALNIGTEPLFEGGTCTGELRLEIADRKPRELPNLSGCFSASAGCISAVSHRPALAPGTMFSSRVLLTGYDLPPGTYQLMVSGRLPLRGPSPERTVPGADLAVRLNLNVLPATATELEGALASLVADAEAREPMRSVSSRAALLESAPPFLAGVIARFSPPYDPGEVAEALRRIGTPESRALLVDLHERTGGDQRERVVPSLARTGDPDLADLLSRIAGDPSASPSSRRYAVLGLGLIGGERGVRQLEGLLPAADAERRADIATALGHTRSRLAVPVLIGMFGNNDTQPSVCGGLRVLTHRKWCQSAGSDPAVQRRRWLQAWETESATAAIYGLDSCQALADADDEDHRASMAEQQRLAATATVFSVRPSGRAPQITAVVPAITSPHSSIMVSGHSLGGEDLSTQRVLFLRATSVHIVKSGANSRSSVDGIEGEQTISVNVPAALEPGRWQVVIDANGRRTPPFAIEVVTPRPIEWRGIWPARPHPSQWITIRTTRPVQRDDETELIDASGRRWPFEYSAVGDGFQLLLPDDVAEGLATVRVLRKNGAPDSPPFTFTITSAPSPLATGALAYMKSVAAGQWSELALDTGEDFEVDRSDRVEIEFTQQGRTFTTDTAGARRTRLQIPAGLKPGSATARSRTWIENTASEWSAAARIRIARRAVPVSVDRVEVFETGPTLLLDGRTQPRFLEVKAGQNLVVYGFFPVAQAADLRIQLTSRGASLDLVPAAREGDLRIALPATLPPGDWQLRIGPVDRSAPARAIVVLRVK